MTQRKQSAMTRAIPGVVRIIGGRWRGSKLPVAEVAGLRPTADRVRETLFNWLQPKLTGARVLDLFAGTGALGLEAASRGAGRVVLIERDPALAASLGATAARLARRDGPSVVEIVCADALHWLSRVPGVQFDLVFVDPPFADALWQSALAALAPWLADDAWLYLESPRAGLPVTGPPITADGWLLHREGSTRDVRYALYRRGAVTLAYESAEQDPARA
jgi:16S rRNA (guanine966-N2)-methyltransferase